MADLLILAGRRPLDDTPSRLLPREWSSIRTPMCADVWTSLLQDHPDRAYCGFLIDGLHAGFRIGFQYGGAVCKRVASNMPTARDHPEVVRGFIETELRMGRVFGPIDSECLPLVQINRLGLVPKNHQPGRWRVIVDDKTSNLLLLFFILKPYKHNVSPVIPLTLHNSNSNVTQMSRNQLCNWS